MNADQTKRPLFFNFTGGIECHEIGSMEKGIAFELTKNEPVRGSITSIHRGLEVVTLKCAEEFFNRAESI